MSEKLKISVYIATSLDGFIARPDGDIKWLMEADSDASEDFGFHAFFDSVDCLIMGRNTYEKVSSFPEWPYSGKRVIVMSKTLTEIDNAKGELRLYRDDINILIDALESEGMSRLYIDGGKTIQGFLQAGLLTDITITRVPILLGDGLPLFGCLEQDIKLKHIETRSYANGFVQSTYEL